MTLVDDSNSRDEDPSDDVVMEWARENKNDLLQIVCGYHHLSLPERESKIIFQPLEHIQCIECRRPSVSELGLCDKYLDHILKDSSEDSQVKLKFANAEEASSLSLWTTAAICRLLSLDRGILSAVVLSIIPMIRPFEWQSLFLPILPARMVDFLDAPVPFIVGIQHKLANLKPRAPNLVQINILSNQVSSCSLPQLPRHHVLISELRPIHSKLSSQDSDAPRHPVYKCDQVQAEAAKQFLTVMRQYMESFCSDLRLHTITSVQSNEKVSILLRIAIFIPFPKRTSLLLSYL